MVQTITIAAMWAGETFYVLPKCTPEKVLEDHTLMGLNTVMASSEYGPGLTAQIAIDGSWGDPYSYWGTPTGVTNARYYTRSENAVSVKSTLF